MKRIISLVILLLVTGAVFGQGNSFDSSKYETIDLFSYRVEENDYGEYDRNHCYFKMELFFDRQSSTTVYFYDNNNDRINMDAKQRYSLQKGQKVIVYFNAKRSGWNNTIRRPYGPWINVLIDYIDGNIAVQRKPWSDYISNGKTNLHGWYLEDIGNGTYRERFFE
jgi:hypothetical protein